VTAMVALLMAAIRHGMSFMIPIDLPLLGLLEISCILFFPRLHRPEIAEKNSLIPSELELEHAPGASRMAPIVWRTFFFAPP